MWVLHESVIGVLGETSVELSRLLLHVQASVSEYVTEDVRKDLPQGDSFGLSKPTSAEKAHNLVVLKEFFNRIRNLVFIFSIE